MAPTGVNRLPEPFAEDGSLNVVIESPRGSTAKWKYEAGVFQLSRPLPAGLAYPYDWGFLPGTRASDGDPLDAMVYWSGASYPGVVVPSRAIGVLRVEQTSRESGNRERNDRLLVVPVSAPAIDVSLLSICRSASATSSNTFSLPPSHSKARTSSCWGGEAPKRPRQRSPLPWPDVKAPGWSTFGHHLPLHASGRDQNEYRSENWIVRGPA